MKLRLTFALVLLLACSPLLILAQTDITQSPRGIDIATKQYELEKKKVEIEDAKLKLEQEKFAEEKKRQGEQISIQKELIKWTAISILIPLILAAFSLWYQTRKSFQLKAVEIILNSRGTFDGSQRAKALRKLFPWMIRKKFENTLELPGEDWRVKKIELFKALTNAEDKERSKILSLYLMLYPEDDWTSDLLEQHWGRWVTEGEQNARFIAEMKEKLADWKKWHVTKKNR